jgi:NAD(P)H dehydrogenase (quinone)
VRIHSVGTLKLHHKASLSEKYHLVAPDYPGFGNTSWPDHKIEFPFENGRHAPISADDQGRVIAHLLAKPAGHEGKIYTLHGPVEMNHTEIAAVMSEVLGARIEYAPTSIEVFKQKMEQSYKFPPFLVQHLVEVAQNYREGIFAGTNDVVEKISGTPALSISAFIEKHRKAFT